MYLAKLDGHGYTYWYEGISPMSVSVILPGCHPLCHFSHIGVRAVERRAVSRSRPEGLIAVVGPHRTCKSI